MDDLRFGVLGPVTVCRDGAEIRIGSAKHDRLLAVLLLHRNERIGRDGIIDLLWGEAPPKSAVNLVQKYIGDLRRAFDAGDLLRSVAGGYQLRVRDEDLDSAVFGTMVACARGTHAAGDLDGARKQIDQALDLWRGIAFDGVEVAVAGTERARLDELRVMAYEERADIMLALGEHDAAGAELARLTAAYPLRERLRELQMVALYRQGRRAEALAVFTTLSDLLARDLGIDPGPQLLRRYEQILRADLALEPPSGDDLPAQPAHPVRQLPLDVAGFTGRDRVLADVIACLRGDHGGRLVAVTGGPGVGKSSLVVHAGHAVRDGFPDGQLYLDLAGTSGAPRDPAQMLAEMLRALSVTGRAIPDTLAERSALFRSMVADRRLLIVLDDAGPAEQVRPLLPAAPGCAVVITSRSLLAGLPGVHHVDLDVLSPGAARRMFTGIVGGERIAAEPGEADAILDCCGGLPLAIRIAGARLAARPAWSLRVLRERLQDESRRLSELQVGDLGVRASLQLSLRMLPAPALRALCLWGLLGPATLPGWVVGPLLDRADPDDVLDALVDANLIRVVRTDSTGQPRYRMHDLIRAHAVEVAAGIPDEDRRSAVGRVLGAWLDLTERASDRLPASLFAMPPGRAERRRLPAATVERLLAAPLAWFDAEQDNLLGMVRLAADHGLDEIAWELAAAPVTYYDQRCLHQNWLHGHRIALAATIAAGNRRGQSVLLRELGQVFIYRDDLGEAVRVLDRSRLLCHEGGDAVGEALSIAMLATVSRVLGRTDEALDRAGQALALVIAAGHRHLEAHLFGSMAVILLAQGDLDAAEAGFVAALDLAEALGDRHRVAVTLRRMSALYDRRGDPDAALDCLRRALETFDGMSDERCAALALMTIGRIHADRRDRDRALPVLVGAVSTFARHGDQRDEAECWRVLGELDLQVGAYGPARQHFGRALRLWRAVGDSRAVRATTEVLSTLAA